MHFRKGQVLIELLLAFVVSSVALVSMAQVATKSVGNSTYSRNRSEANKYAVEAIEWARGVKNARSWTAFTTLISAGDRCLFTEPPTYNFVPSPPSACTTAQVIPGTIFYRKVNFNGAGAGVVTVTVYWTEKNLSYSSVQTIIFKQY